MLFAAAGRPGFSAPAQDGEEKPFDIEAQRVREAEEAKTRKLKKIEPDKNLLQKEIPKPITKPLMTAAERERLAQLEEKRARGQVTQTEYDLEKDNLGRDSNIKF